jgi:hypothetical protein
VKFRSFEFSLRELAGSMGDHVVPGHRATSPAV